MKIPGLQIVTYAKNAAREKLIRISILFSRFRVWTHPRISTDKLLQDQIQSLTKRNGSVALTHQLLDKVTRKNLRSEKTAAKKTEKAHSKYQTSIDQLAGFVNVGTFSLTQQDLLRILYPALANLPSEIDSRTKFVNIGRVFLQLQCHSYMMQLPSKNVLQKVGTFDYGRLQDGSCEKLGNEEMLLKFTEQSGIRGAVILESIPAQGTRDEEAIRALHHLVGTLLSQYGPTSTSEFISTRIIGGAGGLMHLYVSQWYCDPTFPPLHPDFFSGSFCLFPVIL